MACCKPCCGCVDCAEGDQGKCCCGGECCDVGEYCCSGACQATPCEEECECPNPCTMTATSTATEWGLTVEAVATPEDCVACTIQASDTEDNPLRPADQISTNRLQADVTHNGSGWAFDAGALESYAVPTPGGFTSDYEESKVTVYSAFLACAKVDGVSTWTGNFSFLYGHSILESPGGVTGKFQTTTRGCANQFTFSDQCPSPCLITVSMTPEGVTANGVFQAWECSTDISECTEYDENGVETSCGAGPDSPMNNATFTLECREECEEVEPLALTSGPGTELKKILKTIGIVSKPGCSCNKRAQTMDVNGCDWCAENTDTISGWLQEEAQKRNLPYVAVAGKWIIGLAIKRARRGNSR